jgi:trehalose/maltose hydrolase-like predicted phosphorylase
VGLVKDWLTRAEKLCDCRIETLPEEEVDLHEHLVILGDMLENLLVKQDDLNPKETIKEYQTHLKLTQKEIRRREVVILNEQTGQMITQPGWVSSEEQHLIEKLQWEIESCTEQSTVLQAEILCFKSKISIWWKPNCTTSRQHHNSGRGQIIPLPGHCT